MNPYKKCNNYFGFEFINASVVDQFIKHFKCFWYGDDVLRVVEELVGKCFLDNTHCFSKGVALRNEYFLLFVT